MRIFVGQIYVKAGVVFPFSLRFQRWLGDALSERVEVSSQFKNKFGTGIGLGLRLSAKDDIDQPEIQGPTLFKREKTVEFTMFLPHGPNNYHDPVVASALLDQVLRSTVTVLQRVGLDPGRIESDILQLRTAFLNTPGLLDARQLRMGQD